MTGFVILILGLTSMFDGISAGRYVPKWKKQVNTQYFDLMEDDNCSDVISLLSERLVKYPGMGIMSAMTMVK